MSKKCQDVPSGTIAVVLIGRSEVTVKKVIKKEGLLILQPANPSVDARYYSKEEVESPIISSSFPENINVRVFSSIRQKETLTFLFKYIL